MQQKPKTFADDDLFGREAYAKFLEKLILNCGEYHRDDDMKAYTIAIDSPWGTGKSVFLEKFENMLMEDYPEKIRVVHYNAWQNDFWKNAFEPFANTIFRHDLFWEELANETLRDTSKHLMDAAKNVGIAFLKAQLSSVVDVAYLEKAGIGFLDGLKEEMDQSPNSVGKEYRDYTKSIQQLQNAMGDFLKKSLPDGKLVIIIDELDRCRPTFAIDTLEIIKHIMDVQNVVYVFALDVKQLGATIKQIYGADTDATGYLMRFYSYYSRMPEADIMQVLKRISEDIPLLNDVLSDCFDVAKEVQLTVRDIETIAKVYRIMVNEFLNKYYSPRAYKLYWTLLCVKYKQPVAFDLVMKGTSVKEENQLSIFSIYRSSKIGIRMSLQAIEQNKAIKDIEHYSYFGTSDEGTLIGRIYNIKRVKRANIDVDTNSMSLDSGRIHIHGNRMSVDVDTEGCLSEFLFYPDIKRWDDIKHLTPGEFLLQQMEMYNFIPEIE